MERCSKTSFWPVLGSPKVAKSDGELAFGNSPPDLPDEADEPEPAKAVSGTAARAPPSTCAGGQDDVS